MLRNIYGLKLVLPIVLFIVHKEIQNNDKIKKMQSNSY